ncbi:MAG: hypothetical protein IPJ33_05575 [Gammaproteobacteria bacterium]|jgi:hypothetical protein|nr:hypothetical protein [Gammaproteobacteria bacterium]MBP6053673.1 hypothetical protein [Pseudomonadales bacterium]MBK6584319.1 hypothetical protein [Gammaproteobacteria bacterium]MBK7168437.1 hypothetical protein [Gammaproteobacteria bacterium]MBK7520780.1 hypothetical protein [Gammaproteobacteria bacterium]
MRLQIQYRAHYAFGEAVTFSPHLFRLFPRVERHVRVLNSVFEINARIVPLGSDAA